MARFVDPPDRNVLGGPLQPCSFNPITGDYRDGMCTSRPWTVGTEIICAVMTAEYLQVQKTFFHERLLEVIEPDGRPVQPGDRWCVPYPLWITAEENGQAPPIVLACTNETVLRDIPMATLMKYAVDVPDDLSSLE